MKTKIFVITILLLAHCVLPAEEKIEKKRIAEIKKVQNPEHRVVLYISYALEKINLRPKIEGPMFKYSSFPSDLPKEPGLEEALKKSKENSIKSSKAKALENEAREILRKAFAVAHGEIPVPHNKIYLDMIGKLDLVIERQF